MITLLCFFLTLFASPFKPKTRLEAENAALRHQLIILRRKVRGHVRLTNGNRLSLVLLYRLYATTRNSSGEMIRKLSVIRSRKRSHFLVTVRLRKRRIADLNCAKVS